MEPVIFKIPMHIPIGQQPLTLSSMEEPDHSKPAPIPETRLFAEETEGLEGVELVPTEAEAEADSPAVEVDIFLAEIRAEVEVAPTTPEPIKTTVPVSTKDMASS